jgi:sirohydrochlorin ferrochelatase
MDAVAAARPGSATALGFVDVQHPDTDETLAGLPAHASATVVPLLLSAGYHVHVDLTDSVRAQTDRKVTLAAALGPDARLTDLLVERLVDVGLTDADALVLAVAGSSDARAVADCRVVAEQLAAASGHDVTIGFLSAAEPRLDAAIASVRVARPDARVIVSSYLLAPGYFQSLAERAGADLTTEPLLASGRPVPQQLVDVVLDRHHTCSACTTCGGFCRRSA